MAAHQSNRQAGRPILRSSPYQLLHTCTPVDRPRGEETITGPGALQPRRAFGVHHVPSALFFEGITSDTLPHLQGRALPSSTIFACVDQASQLPVAPVDEALNQLP